MRRPRRADGGIRQEIVIEASTTIVHDDQMSRTVALVVFDQHQLLDLAGPADAFRTATLLGAEPGYEPIVVSLDGAPVRSVSGVTVAAEAALGDLDHLHTLMVVGGLGVQTARHDPRLLHELRRASQRSTRTTSVCSGALLLAAAGLLDGYDATTHWSAAEQLADEHPAVTVHPDRIYVHDRDRWTSAGVTAGIDLSLAMIEADHDAELARAVAAWLVVFVRRPGGQSQFSAQLRAQPARRSELAELQRWLPDHLTDDLRIPALAQRCRMSERTFVRTFRAETGTTPAAYVEALRIEAARRLLETSDLTVAAIARQVGFGGPERLHRAVRRQLGTTPDRYRQHFAPLSPTPPTSPAPTGAHP
jgi:transcriptional regulator GlxA family with amidase domain